MLGLRYDSEIKDSPDDAAKFDDQYDHPVMFIYGIFLSVWLAFLVQGWTTKQKVRLEKLTRQFSPFASVGA